jgi:hypothetical protein
MIAAMPAKAINGNVVAGAACVVTGGATAHVKWTGGSGGFTFNNLVIVCAGAGVAGPMADVATISTRSTGIFHNLACGTGDAGSGASGGTTTINSVTSQLPSAVENVVDPPDSSGQPELVDIFKHTNLDYAIDFAGGQGVLTWSTAGDTQLPGVSTPNLPSGPNPWTGTGTFIPAGGGYINISPVRPDDGWYVPESPID